MKTKSVKTAPIDYKKLKPHPMGAIFPPMDDEAYKGLVDGMKKGGYDTAKPIILARDEDGIVKILDGNHRYTASAKAKVEPVFKMYEGDDAISFVLRENLHRRHLTPSQAATIGAELVEKIKQAERDAKAAAKLQAAEAKAAAKKAGTKAPKIKVPKRAPGSKAGKVAKALNVSERNVAEAGAIKKADPEEFEKVKAGKKTLNAASLDVAKKKSAKERDGEAYAIAIQTIEAGCGGLSSAILGRMKPKEVIEFAGLDTPQMTSIKRRLEGGWTLKAAMGYSAPTLSPAHTIRNGLERAVDAGGHHTMEGDVYGFKYRVEFHIGA